MMLLLHSKLSSLLPCFPSTTKTNLTSSSPSHHFLRTLLHFSTSTGKNPSPQNPFIIEYLINSCGFSSDIAIKASKYLTHFNSPSQPDSVRHFLNHTGLDNTQIKNLIIKYPRLLSTKVEKTMKPKLTTLQELGFSHSEIIQVITRNPLLFRTRDLRPKIEFWRDFLGTHENLLKAMKSSFLLSCDIDEVIMRNISFLRECSISDSQIVKMILLSPSSITRSLDTIKNIVSHADEFGVPRDSGMFVYVFQAISNISRATLNAKIDLLKSLGWSQEEVLAAIPKAPYLLKVSEKKIRGTIDFLMKEAGCKPSYIALNPMILLYSLSGRLMPRCYVIRILKSEGLLKSDYGLWPVISLNEKRFVDKFVIPNEGKVPKLREAYVAACKEINGYTETGDIFEDLDLSCATKVVGKKHTATGFAIMPLCNQTRAPELGGSTIVIANHMDASMYMDALMYMDAKRSRVLMLKDFLIAGMEGLISWTG